VPRNPKLFRTPHTFPTSEEAVAFFNEEREEGVGPLPAEVIAFLGLVKDYDSDVVFNVQPGFKTHYVTCARPDDHHAWLYAKPNGITFMLADERNVQAVLDMWGTPNEEGDAVFQPPADLLPVDAWFAAPEVEPNHPTFPAAEMSLRLAARWAAFKGSGKVAS
jgi:hypothetical protein